MLKLILTPLVVQALTIPDKQRKSNYSTLRDNGIKILRAEVTTILKSEYNIHEYTWFFVERTIDNRNLVRVFDVLKETYNFSIEIPKHSRVIELTPKMKASILCALVYTTQTSTENRKFFNTIITEMRKYIPTEEDAYLRVYKIIEQDNVLRTHPVDMKKLFVMQSVGEDHIAVFTYMDITVRGRGTSTQEARTKACEAWLLNAIESSRH